MSVLSTKMSKWKLLFVNSCETKGPISTATEFLTSAKKGQINQCDAGIYFEKYSRTPIIWTLVLRIANNPDRLGPWGKYVENSAKLT
jgi:hypothetical protein